MFNMHILYRYNMSICVIYVYVYEVRSSLSKVLKARESHNVSLFGNRTSNQVFH